LIGFYKGKFKIPYKFNVKFFTVWTIRRFVCDIAFAVISRSVLRKHVEDKQMTMFWSWIPPNDFPIRRFENALSFGNAGRLIFFSIIWIVSFRFIHIEPALTCYRQLKFIEFVKHL